MRIGIQTWGSEGDVRPFLALAAGLSRAGHQVTVVATSNSGHDYCEIAQAHGFEFRSAVDASAAILTVDDLLAACLASSNPLKQAEIVMQYGFDPLEAEMYQAARELCRKNDLVIGHFFVYPLRIAAAIAGVPWVSVNLVHNCLPSRHLAPPGLPDLGHWVNPLGWKFARKLVNGIFIPRVNRLCEIEGLPCYQDVMNEVWASEQLNLIAVSPAICQKPADWKPNHQVCGFFDLPENGDDQSLPDGLEEFLAAGSPPVYLTFGSMMPGNVRAVRETVGLWRQAVSLAGCRAILQAPIFDENSLVPSNKIFHLTRAPYKKVFPSCAAVVHHGGAGTTQRTLQSGSPSVVVAHMADQFFWGQELFRLGVAPRHLLRARLSPKNLAERISVVLQNPRMKQQAEMLSQNMAAEDGVGQAVELIAGRFAQKEP